MSTTLLRMADVAARLGKSTRWLHDHLAKHPAGRRAGRTRLFTEEDFAALVADLPKDQDRPSRRTPGIRLPASKMPASKPSASRAQELAIRGQRKLAARKAKDRLDESANVQPRKHQGSSEVGH